MGIIIDERGQCVERRTEANFGLHFIKMMDIHVEGDEFAEDSKNSKLQTKFMFFPN